MCDLWPDIKSAKNRFELTLAGEDVKERVARLGGCFPADLFKLRKLNYLCVDSVGLLRFDVEALSAKMLVSLTITGNAHLCSISKLSELKQLRHCDLSHNALEQYPEIWPCSIQTINLANNRLKCLSLANEDCLPQLRSIDASHNLIETFTLNGKLPLLKWLNIAENRLSSLPDSMRECVPELKSITLTSNCFTSVPTVLLDLKRLRNFEFKGNPIEEPKLKAFIERDSSHSARNALHTILRGTDLSSSASKISSSLSIQPEKTSFVVVPANRAEVDCSRSQHLQLLCFILQKVDFVSTKRLKAFWKDVDKLNSSVLCNKKLDAYVTAHDFSKLASAGRLSLEVGDARRIHIRPRLKGSDVGGGDSSEEMSAHELISSLKLQAEKHRKAMKRNVRTNEFKFLRQVSQKVSFIHDQTNVISIPPLTASSMTKVSVDTEDLLVEITSTKNRELCENVADRLLEIANNRCFNPDAHTHVIEQVKSNTSLYPSSNRTTSISFNFLKKEQ